MKKIIALSLFSSLIFTTAAWAMPGTVTDKCEAQETKLAADQTELKRLQDDIVAQQEKIDEAQAAVDAANAAVKEQVVAINTLIDGNTKTRGGGTMQDIPMAGLSQATINKWLLTNAASLQMKENLAVLMAVNALQPLYVAAVNATTKLAKDTAAAKLAMTNDRNSITKINTLISQDQKALAACQGAK